MVDIRSQVKPFSFRVNNRVYYIDFVYKVLGIDDESGTGKTLFVRDIVNKQDLSITSIDGKARYSISAFSGNTQSETIYNYILNGDLSNKLVIIDDIEYLDYDLILQGIRRTKELNTQWLFLGHGDFPGIVAVDAIRSIQIERKKGSRLMQIKFAF